MSLKSVLKNIYSYLEVLEAARTDQVKLWDLNALENAFKWAAYAEEIHSQANGKVYQSELKQHILKLGKLKLWKLGCSSVNLELLEKADRILYESLLQNPHLPMKVFEKLIRRTSKISSDRAKYLQIFYELCEDVHQPEFAKKIRKGTVSFPYVQKSEFSEEVVVTQARLLVQFLTQKILDSQISDVNPRFLRDLKRIFVETVKKKHGWEIVLTSILVIGTEPLHNVTKENKEIADQVLSLLVQIVTELASEASIWRNIQDPLLIEVLNICSPLLEEYIKYLVSTGNSFISVGQGWSGTSLDSPNYDQLVHSWKILLRQPHTKYISEEKLVSLCDEKVTENNSIWQQIMKDVS